MLLGSWGTGSVVGKFVCLKPTCVFLDGVVWCRKRGGCVLPNVGLADSIKKISKGPL